MFDDDELIKTAFYMLEGVLHSGLGILLVESWRVFGEI